VDAFANKKPGKQAGLSFAMTGAFGFSFAMIGAFA
jgi:hypothetical protein